MKRDRCGKKVLADSEGFDSFLGSFGRFVASMRVCEMHVISSLGWAGEDTGLILGHNDMIVPIIFSTFTSYGKAENP